MSGSPVPLRYAAIAAFCFAASNAIVIGGDRMGLSMPQAVAIAFVIVGAAGYLLHCHVTFSAAPEWLGFLRYLAAMGANLPLSILCIWIFVTALGLPMAAAAPLSSAAMVVLNFLASRWAICRASARLSDG